MHVSDDAYFDKRLFMLQGAARLAGEADRRQAEHLGVAGNALPRPRLGGWRGRCRIQLGSSMIVSRSTPDAPSTAAWWMMVSTGKWSSASPSMT